MCLTSLDDLYSEQEKYFDYRDRLHLISAPTLIMVGDKDWICPLGKLEYQDFIFDIGLTRQNTRSSSRRRCLTPSCSWSKMPTTASTSRRTRSFWRRWPRSCNRKRNTTCINIRILSRCAPAKAGLLRAHLSEIRIRIVRRSALLQPIRSGERSSTCANRHTAEPRPNRHAQALMLYQVSSC